MSVVVTGAAGFIGRHVVSVLLGRGVEVVGVDRRPWPALAGERLLVSDLADRDPQVDRWLQRCEGVIHLAGCPGVRDRRPDVAMRRWRDNVLAGDHVLHATPPRTPVVVASSSSVYGGAGPANAPVARRENDALHPRGGYARSKRELERRCAQRASRGGLVSVVRPFTVAGEGQRPDMAITQWIDALLTGTPVRLFGSGARRRDITDVHDVAEGVAKMLERRVTTTVNLGTGTTHRLDHILAETARQCGVVARVVVEAAMREDVAATRADTGRCRDVLGFVPTTDLPALIARQLSATRRHASAVGGRVLAAG